MVGGDLAGDVEPLGLGAPHHVEAARRREVGDVVAAGGVLGEDEVARHHHVLGGAGDAGQAQLGRPLPLVHDAAAGEGQVLGVLDHRDAEVLGVEQGAAHQLGVHHRLAVVRDRPHAGAHHLADLRQLLAQQPLADGADRIDAGETVPPRLQQDVLGHRPAVVDRVGVGHAGRRR